MRILRGFLYFVATLGMYLGVPLLGWGLGDGTAATGLAFAAFFFLPLTDRRGVGLYGAGPAVRWVGAALALAGNGLELWSGLLLGRFYSAKATLQEGHRLVTAGIYGAIRHPRYLGVLLLALAVSLLFRSWISLGLWPALSGILLFRIHDEEGLMRQEFGQEGEEYCRRTWRLVPLLY